MSSTLLVGATSNVHGLSLAVVTINHYTTAIGLGSVVLSVICTPCHPFIRE